MRYFSCEEDKRLKEGVWGYNELVVGSKVGIFIAAEEETPHSSTIF